MRRTRIAEVLAQGKVGDDVLVKGWVRTARRSKTVAFLQVNDGSCMSSVQGVLPADHAQFEEVGGLGTGACVSLRGTLRESPGKGQRFDLAVESLEVLGVAPSDYVLQKKRHSLEFLRTIPHLRPRTNTIGAALRVRSVLAQAVHSFYQDRGFVYVHTPVITASDCEGAGEMFRVSTLPADAPPRRQDGAIDWGQDFFGREAFLTVSGQLEGEMCALALGDIYTFGPTFRAENSNTARHVAEFWMIEPECAFYDLQDTLDLARDFTLSVVGTALERSAEDLAFFDRFVSKGLLQRLEALSKAPFEVVTYTDAVALLKRAQAGGTSFEFAPEWGADLQTEHERWLCAHVGGPCFVTDWPKELKNFYMRQNDDGRTVQGLDMLVPGVGELIGGSVREERLDCLESAMGDHGIDREAYDWYLQSRRYGTAPHAGFGMGFERLVMYVTGIANIRDVIAFPRAVRQLS